ncbi:MAG TPA: OmpA family protein [Burkholderiaceae bacterium]|nr:OmpA family protein [Burkholderiaceae bacterium]
MKTAFLWPRLLSVCIGVLVVAGCSTPPPPPPPVPKVSVVLLPQTDASGNPIRTAVSVTSGQQALQLDQPFALAESDPKGQLAQRISSAAEVQARYGEVLKIQPPSPEIVVLRFLPGKSQLTPESEQQLPELIQRARARAGGEILVVGHTDRVGSRDANDALSLQRAQAIVNLLKARGFSEDLLSAIGRGEREPAVPTDDEVAEPRNRRAEVIIR